MSNHQDEQETGRGGVRHDRDAIYQAVAELDDPTTSDILNHLDQDIPRRSLIHVLNELEDEGQVESRTVGARTKLWSASA